MSTEQDPFELLRKKLEAKKKGGLAGQQKARPQPQGRPQHQGQPGHAPTPAQKSQDQRGPAPPPAKPPAATDPAAPPRGLQKTAFAKEDLRKMERTSEKVSGDAPLKFVSHRFDAKLDKVEKKVVKKKSSVEVERPKGFKSDRFDRG